MKTYLLNKETRQAIKSIWYDYTIIYTKNYTKNYKIASWSGNVTEASLGNLLYLLLTHTREQVASAYMPLTKKTNSLVTGYYKRPFFNVNFIAFALITHIDSIDKLKALNPLLFKMYGLALLDNPNLYNELRELAKNLANEAYCKQDLSSWIN